jgi:Tfp pilus assembly major pilin PilA
MTTIYNPKESYVFMALMLRGHLRLLDKGMKNSRMSGTKILKSAAQITGKPYKRGQYQQAIADLTAHIEEHRGE